MMCNTKLLHGYDVVDKYTGAASIPVYQTSTFSVSDLYTEEKRHMYTRFSNPTIDALEGAIACIENSKYALVYSSGMAAISQVLMLLKNGDHVIFPNEVYGGTCQFSRKILPQYGIETSYVDMSDIEVVKSHIKTNTKMIYIETPSNPLLKVTDIKTIVEICKQRNILSVIDNTFMTSLSQNCINLGVDIVVESVTKFINGHSDVVAGLAATNNEEIFDKLKLYQKNFGAILGVQDAWLVLRGIKTMGIRLEKSISNAQKIAEFLSHHPKIKKVYYPGLKDHKNHDIHMSQAKNGGAVLSFELESKEALIKFTNKIKIPIIAVSLGGVESIISHPATMSHACLSEEERREQGVLCTLLRLSCGIEGVDDLIEDFKQALED
ncbi:PLP-dependent transferase [Helcococcus kunzii]|uniref:trans-sulfuration enzyme family protein n=1 Tax=Helcococcus kunzii TaxID=40091 RepID=UPI0020163335|nr:PLP-dependent aspartate aminotransferase family protein [Helcococcus kunzii]QUY64638.1 PLP-dependent transferase [Helcococcus kunzii]